MTHIFICFLWHASLKSHGLVLPSTQEAEMPNRTGTYAVMIGLAAVFAWSTSTLAAQKPRAPATDSYENHGALPNSGPPVPGFAVSGYKPGMCWKVWQRDWDKGN